MTQYILAVGNVVDGITFVGPFADEADAAEEGSRQKDEWVTAPLEPAFGDDGVWHINVYERDRAYGGPEEGGWWYDTGRYMPQMSVTLDRSGYDTEQVNDMAVALQERLNHESDRDGVPPVGYTQYRGGRYLVQTDTVPGADWPAERPHYE